MIMAGKNIRQKNDPLQKVGLERLTAAIRNPKPHLLTLIRQLRTIQTLDPNRYRQLKVQLPYVCCGNFHPPYRRTEHFGSIQYFILDIDHLLEKEILISDLKEKLRADDRIVLMFNSPGNNGLKVFFRLKEKCYDAAQYSLFYKAFSTKFSEQYHLQQVLDTATSDVTRACFVSWDPEIYYNPEHSAVDRTAFIDFEKVSEVKKLEKALKKSTKDQLPKETQPKRTLTAELLAEIKGKLKPGPRPKPSKIIHVPKELEKIMATVEKTVVEYDILIKEVINIHYGKKVVFTYGQTHWAEINIFYGKKGFTIVRSPKRGRDENLEEVVYRILCELFFDTKKLESLPGTARTDIQNQLKKPG